MFREMLLISNPCQNRRLHTGQIACEPFPRVNRPGVSRDANTLATSTMTPAGCGACHTYTLAHTSQTHCASVHKTISHWLSSAASASPSPRAHGETFKESPRSAPASLVARVWPPHVPAFLRYRSHGCTPFTLVAERRKGVSVCVLCGSCVFTSHTVELFQSISDMRVRVEPSSHTRTRKKNTHAHKHAE